MALKRQKLKDMKKAEKTQATDPTGDKQLNADAASAEDEQTESLSPQDIQQKSPPCLSHLVMSPPLLLSPPEMYQPMLLSPPIMSRPLHLSPPGMMSPLPFPPADVSSPLDFSDEDMASLRCLSPHVSSLLPSATPPPPFSSPPSIHRPW